MMKLTAAVSILLLLTACGGGRNQSRSDISNMRTISYAGGAQFASGPIADACQSAGRKEASRHRCGCVQSVANRSLTRSEQLRGATFFKDPQKAQDLRQSSNLSDERFWLKWKAYGSETARVCR